MLRKAAPSETDPRSVYDMYLISFPVFITRK